MGRLLVLLPCLERQRRGKSAACGGRRAGGRARARFGRVPNVDACSSCRHMRVRLFTLYTFK